jgi:hypothetical protein
MNSSLLCHGKEKDDEPELVLGERQFIIRPVAKVGPFAAEFR